MRIALLCLLLSGCIIEQRVKPVAPDVPIPQPVNPDKPDPDVPDPVSVNEFEPGDDNVFQSLYKDLSKEKTIIFFYRSNPKCPYCDNMKPILKELAKERKDINFIWVDINKCPKISREYGVRSIPTFFSGSNSRVGECKKEDLLKLLENNSGFSGASPA